MGGGAYVFGGGIKHRRHPYGVTRPPTGLVVDGKRLPDGVITMYMSKYCMLAKTCVGVSTRGAVRSLDSKQSKTTNQIHLIVLQSVGFSSREKR